MVHGEVGLFPWEDEFLQLNLFFLVSQYFSYHSLNLRVVLSKKLRESRATFFGGNSAAKRKIVWIKWEKLCVSKEHGGLGFKSFKEFNVSLIFKWKWSLLQGTGAL